MPQLAARGPVHSFFETSLLLLVATGFVGVLVTGRLGAVTAAAMALALVARALILAGWLRMPLSDVAVKILTVLYIGFYPLDFLYVSRDFLDATIRLVFFVAVIKLLTARTELANLLTYMDGKSGAEELVGKLLNDPNLLKSLAAAPKPEAPQSN